MYQRAGKLQERWKNIEPDLAHLHDACQGKYTPSVPSAGDTQIAQRGTTFWV